MSSLPNIGHWELTSLIGRGGMGMVYKARHKLMDEFFALKIIHPEYSNNQDFRTRFLGEAKTLHKLQHPHIVKFQELGEHEGSLYMVTELLVGRNLEEIIVRDKSPQDPVLVHSVMLGCAHALGFGHEMGVVHRDVKPGNIFLHHDQRVEKPIVKLLDYGLARSSFFDQNKTADGIVVGTPAYLPPEVLKGSTNDPRSDVFGLGALAFELLCGRKVIPIPENKDASVWAIMDALYKGYKEGIPRVRDLRPEVPPLLAEAVDACLNLHHEQRPADGNAVLKLLSVAARPAPMVQVPPQPPPQQPREHTAAYGPAALPPGPERITSPSRHTTPPGPERITSPSRHTTPPGPATPKPAPQSSHVPVAARKKRTGVTATGDDFDLSAATSSSSRKAFILVMAAAILTPVILLTLSFWQTQIGRLYEHGWVAQQDYRQAARWYGSAQDQDPGLVALARGRGAVGNDPVRGRWLDASCLLGNAEGCMDYARALESGQGVAQDLPRALSLYLECCEKKSADACTKAAEFYRNGQGTARSAPTALRFLDRACTLNSPQACLAAGDTTLTGEAGDPDYQKVAWYFTNACENGVPLGCTRLGDMYFDGSIYLARDQQGEQKRRKNTVEACELYQKACNRGEENACGVITTRCQ